MRKLKRLIPALLLAYLFIAGCGPAVVVKRPPPPRTEVKPHKPYTNAVWINGHWKWRGGKHVWISGHWTKARPGKTWVNGHWKQTPKGWVHVKGHWR